MELLKFEKEGCAPCQMVQMHLDNKNVVVKRIDAFDNPEESAKYEIGSLPTLVLVDETGQEVGRSIGFNPDEIDNMVARLEG